MACFTCVLLFAWAVYVWMYPLQKYIMKSRKATVKKVLSFLTVCYTIKTSGRHFLPALRSSGRKAFYLTAPSSGQFTQSKNIFKEEFAYDK